MEEALLARLRASAAIIAIAGEIPKAGSDPVVQRPTIDWIERHSDDATAFPAAVLQVAGDTRRYDLDGNSGLKKRLIRCECMGLSYDDAKELTRAIVAECELEAVEDGVRFARGQKRFERDMQPEDIGGNLRIYRTIFDMTIITTT